MNKYHEEDLSQYTFLITGGAGFIGSNLVEYLLQYGAKKVRVLDNLSTGFMDNLKEFQDREDFEFIEGDIRDLNTCKSACEGVDFVSHQAALGSVPRSINDPITTNEVNVTGFLNMLVAVKESGVKRLIYAASSSTYGDSTSLPKVENKIGNPLSPYAVTKYVNELYANVFSKTYGIETIGLRYFNVFGPKQSPKGAYAAVIPLFIKALKEGAAPVINGDGEQTRDFTYVENAVQANIKALLTKNPKAINEVYNIAYGDRISLNQLWSMMNEILGTSLDAKNGPARQGDIKDSLADISKGQDHLNYQPGFDVKQGLMKILNA